MYTGRNSTRWVELVDAGMFAWPQGGDRPDTDDAGYMGIWPVGPTCARRIPKRYHARPAD